MSTLSKIFIAAIRKVIHSSSMIPQYMLSILKEIKHGFKSTLFILKETKISDLYKLEKITKMSVFCENQ